MLSFSFPAIKTLVPSLLKSRPKTSSSVSVKFTDTGPVMVDERSKPVESVF